MLSSNDDLVNYLLTTGAIKTKQIGEAFKKVDRADFVLPSYQKEAYSDHALPIGSGQTISQPTTIAFMLELLQPEPGNKVLEIGSGSGYVAALLSQLVGEIGKVIAVERLNELVKMAQDNLRKYNYEQLKIFLANGSSGFGRYSPYDRIIISAAASKIPTKVIEQLIAGGSMVFPHGENSQEIILLQKSKNKILQVRYPGFVFVPLVENN